MKTTIALSFMAGLITAMLPLIILALAGSEFGIYRKTSYGVGVTKMVSCQSFLGDGFYFTISITETGGESERVIRFITKSGYRELEASESAEKITLGLSNHNFDNKIGTDTLFIENKKSNAIEFHKMKMAEKADDIKMEHRIFNVQDGQQVNRK